MVTTQPLVMGVRGDFPGNSMADLIARAKANPGGVHYASQGIGGGNHMAALLLAKHAGTTMNHVPYQGAVPGVQAMLNFAPASLHAPAGVTVRTVDMALELEILSYALVSAKAAQR